MDRNVSYNKKHIKIADNGELIFEISKWIDKLYKFADIATRKPIKKSKKSQNCKYCMCRKIGRCVK